MLMIIANKWSWTAFFFSVLLAVIVLLFTLVPIFGMPQHIGCAPYCDSVQELTRMYLFVGLVGVFSAGIIILGKLGISQLSRRSFDRSLEIAILSIVLAILTFGWSVLFALLFWLVISHPPRF